MMSDIDYLNLGVSINSTNDEIRIAYKRLARKYHPDKQLHLTDNSKFITISESYQNIIKERENNNYSISNNDKGSYDYLYIIIRLIIRLIIKLYNDKIYLNNKKALEINLKVSINDIYNAVIKKLVVKVYRFINGVKTMVSESYYISLLNYRERYIFKSKGDQIDDINYNDLVVNIIIDNKINVIDNRYDWDIINNDIICNTYLSLYEYLYVFNMDIRYYNDNELIYIYETPYIIKESIINGMGIKYYDMTDNKFKYGDLKILFNLKDNIHNKYNLKVLIKDY